MHSNRAFMRRWAAGTSVGGGLAALAVGAVTNAPSARSEGHSSSSSYGALALHRLRTAAKASPSTVLRQPLPSWSRCPAGPVPSTADALPLRKDLRRSYRVGRVIGCGGFGRVHLAEETASARPVAIKHVSKATTSKDKFLQEVAILRSMGGRNNIISLREAFEMPDSYVMVTDLADGIELFEHLVAEGPFTESRARGLVHEIATTLHYLHAHHVVHGDLKPENIVLTSDSSMRLVDFGQSFREDEWSERLRSIGSGVVTVAYAAPEVLDAQGPAVVGGSAMDLWALGVVLFILLCGFHPFDPANDLTDEELRERILRGQFDDASAEWQELSAPAQRLIRRLLEVDPVKRMTAEETLGHEWLCPS